MYQQNNALVIMPGCPCCDCFCKYTVYTKCLDLSVVIPPAIPEVVGICSPCCGEIAYTPSPTPCSIGESPYDTCDPPGGDYGLSQEPGDYVIFSFPDTMTCLGATYTYRNCYYTYAWTPPELPTPEDWPGIGTKWSTNQTVQVDCLEPLPGQYGYLNIELVGIYLSGEYESYLVMPDGGGWGFELCNTYVGGVWFPCP